MAATPEPRYDPTVLDHWARCDGADPQTRQGPVEELLAEHQLMSAVLAAMKKEADALVTGRSLRVEFWSAVVDFIGNFVHLCHRAKEEKHFFPTLLRRELAGIDSCETLSHEHTLAKELTLSLCSAVEEGDWERVVRLTSSYGGFMGPHMTREEQELAALQSDCLPSAEETALRQGFRDVDTATLGAGGRRHVLELSRRLCRDTGVPHPLDRDTE